MATIREQYERRERDMLSPYAQLAAETKGRQRPAEKCAIRTEYQRDRDKIIHCKSFRRLKHKTQVFIAPQKDHYRTRLTHTLEVSQIARTVARALRLNEDLAEAMSLGHDLGHTPFGHRGERVLDRICTGGFHHYLQSLRVVDVLENGCGLNLTWEVRDGIANHTGACSPSTLEGKILKYADRFAYINHDIDDAIRSGILTADALPADCVETLGARHSARVDTLITDIISHSMGKNDITMSAQVEAAMLKLRGFLFENVYNAPSKTSEEEKAAYIIEQMFFHFVSHPEKLPDEYRALLAHWDKERVVCDYIAGMTDIYAISTYGELFIPRGWTV